MTKTAFPFAPRPAAARLAASALVLCLAGTGGPALAQDRDATAAERERVVSALAEAGYRDVVDVDVVGPNFQADATSPEGRDVEVFLDRDTLRIVRVADS